LHASLSASVFCVVILFYIAIIYSLYNYCITSIYIKVGPGSILYSIWARVRDGSGTLSPRPYENSYLLTAAAPGEFPLSPK
jgi:hypothetical protein